MKTKLFMWLLIILLIFTSSSTGSQTDDNFFNLKLYSKTIQTTTLKTGKSYTEEYDSYFFITKSGIYNTDVYGLFHLKYLENPTFKYTYTVTGDIIYKIVIVNTFDVNSNKECLFTLNNSINSESYIITLRYNTHLFKFDCKLIE